MAFCTKCGASLGGGKFCTSCGAPVASESAVSTAATANPINTSATASATTNSSPVVKILMIVLGIIVLVALLGLGTCVYVGYRAKKKVDEVRQAYKSNNPKKLEEALGMGSGRSTSDGPTSARSSAASDSPLSFPTMSGGQPGTESKVPLRPNLTVVTAIAQWNGDYESIKRIEKVTESGVSLNYRADNIPNPTETLSKTENAPRSTSSTTAHRTVRIADLREAHEYSQLFGPSMPDVMPGTTAISMSQAVLNDLKSKGETPFTYRAGGLQGALGSLVGGLGALAGSGGTGSKETDDLEKLGKVECTLKRVNDGTHAFPVLLNDMRVSLPAIHAQCNSEDETGDFYILDDGENPLALAWKLGSGDTLQVVKISYPPVPEGSAGTGAGSGGGPGADAGAGQQIEQQLQEKGQAEVYGIYFDFASDKIKPESEPVLKEIADALGHNPTWRLRVEGHTDNVGGDEYNMELSQRRAEAVKQALVARYHIVADRLTPQGFGALRPKEPNDTLAGRARNRRVELVKE